MGSLRETEHVTGRQRSAFSNVHMACEDVLGTLQAGQYACERIMHGGTASSLTSATWPKVQ